MSRRSSMVCLKLCILHREKKFFLLKLSEITKIIFPLAKSKKVEYRKRVRKLYTRIQEQRCSKELLFGAFSVFRRRKR